MQAMKWYKGIAVGGVAFFSATGTQAAVTISSAITTNMTCSGGVCAPTAKNAVLNAGDLETLLASGNVTVTTTGTSVQASDIDVKAALSWSSPGALSLQANKTVAIDSPVTIAGLSGLAIQTGGTNGAFSFGKKGNVTFANLSSILSINGAAYTLVGDLKTLASDIAAIPTGNFALANNYDAGQGGSYSIDEIYTGSFEGLGNTISNWAGGGVTLIDGEWLGGLFAELGTGGVIENVGLANASVIYGEKIHGNKPVYIAALVAINLGTIRFSWATGTVNSRKLLPNLGGLVGGNGGTISNSYAAVKVSAAKGSAGGLAAFNSGLVRESYATGAVSGISAGGLLSETSGITMNSYAAGIVQVINYRDYQTVGGGLVGLVSLAGGAIIDCYATGDVSGANGSAVGGLAGVNQGGTQPGTISFSYSTGVVNGGTGSIVGGLVGDDESPAGSLTDTYWDTDTSGQNQGAGNNQNDPGITGLTTAQFQSGLPAGFDPAVWSEKTNIDDGFPYLLANKPGK